jgi:DNA-directed RNA polymerase specialized sigma24 family protein
MTLRLRDLTDDERVEVQRITRSHTLGAAFVRRAQIVVHALGGLKAEEIARRMDLCGNTVRHWINRFNARGLDGLEEDVRTGRPPTFPPSSAVPSSPRP